MDTKSQSIDTENFSEKLRRKAVDTDRQKILLTNFAGSQQEKDFSEPANCDGFGRIRHFRRIGTAGWPTNPLPIDPACHKLGLNQTDLLQAQVFQNAACNWRCWYCFVPFNLLNANPEHARWMGAIDILDLYEREANPPRMIDLTGGQPDLTPEWIPWMMRELKRRNLDSQVYLWSDDNLSNDYFWRYLSTEDIQLIKGYRNYGKVCCFKGFDSESFAFNTKASPELFDQQFDLFKRFHILGLDLYAYATFTTPSDEDPARAMTIFVDRLQEISENLPLRVVPLEIRAFTPMMARMGDLHHGSIEKQWNAVRCWEAELERRFAKDIRSTPIYEIKL